MNIGKIFETEFKNSIPSWCYYYRLRDGTAAYGGNANMRFQAKNICDCIVIGQAFTYFIELKNTNQKSLSLSNIKENQLTENEKYLLINSNTKHLLQYPAQNNARFYPE